ncbi:hypothetical protein SAMN05216338_101057 [Bradyrhizobium sp. Rc2d]|nr:hypothetical protein SAMN05216338_101057 [Bradyrhizobium sp. Rc2d]
MAAVRAGVDSLAPLLRGEGGVRGVAANTVRVGLAEAPPHPEFAIANSGLSPQAGRGERATSSS